jgi:GTP-binding protein
LQKALAQDLKIIVVINKVDRPEVQGTGRMQEVINQVFDLFVELGANEEQADFPIVFACSREGWCTTDESEVPKLLSKEIKGSLKPIFDLVLEKVPSPRS